MRDISLCRSDVLELTQSVLVSRQHLFDFFTDSCLYGGDLQICAN